MSSSSDTQTRKAAGKPAGTVSEAPAQDILWKKFDAMLKEFLEMEQTSPAATPRKTVSGK